MLAYTLQKMLESQQALIERDMAADVDEDGGEQAADWQPLATVPCCFWWWKESSRGPAKVLSSAQRAVALSEGGMLMAQGTDITTEDRISAVENLDSYGNVIGTIAGPFLVNALSTPGALEGFTQVTWVSP